MAEREERKHRRFPVFEGFDENSDRRQVTVLHGIGDVKVERPDIVHQGGKGLLRSQVDGVGRMRFDVSDLGDLGGEGGDEAGGARDEKRNAF